MSRLTLDMKIKKLYRNGHAVQRSPSEVSVPLAAKMTTDGIKVSGRAAYYEKWSEIKHSRPFCSRLSFHEKLLEFIMDHIIVYPSTLMRDFCLSEDIERELQSSGLAGYRPRTFDQLQRHVKVILRRQPHSADVSRNSIRKSLARLYSEYQCITADPPSALLSKASGKVSDELLLSCHNTADAVRDASILALAGVVEWRVETLVKMKVENFHTPDGEEWFFDNFERRKARWIRLPLEVTWQVLMLIGQQLNTGTLFTGGRNDGTFALTSSDIVEIIARRLALYALAQKARGTGYGDAPSGIGPQLQSIMTQHVRDNTALIGRRRQNALAAQIRERRNKRLSFSPPTHPAEAQQEPADAKLLLQYKAECGALDQEPQSRITRCRTPLIVPLSTPKLPGGHAEVVTCSTPVKRPRKLTVALNKQPMQPMADYLSNEDEDYFPEDWDSAVRRFYTHKSNRGASEDEAGTMDKDDPSDEEWSEAILQKIGQDDEGN